MYPRSGSPEPKRVLSMKSAWNWDPGGPRRLAPGRRLAENPSVSLHFDGPSPLRIEPPLGQFTGVEKAAINDDLGIHGCHGNTRPGEVSTGV